MSKPLISVITPTTGEPSFLNLLKSLYIQDIDFEHIVLWDDKRAINESKDMIPFLIPLDIRDDFRWKKSYNIQIPGNMVNGVAAGSSLRAIGLMAAQGKYVVFADSDVWYESNHLQNLLNTVKDKQWGFCRRKIWNSKKEYLGIDNFEAIGNSLEKRVPYILVDNNTMIFERRFGTSGAVLYRETQEYNDDRLFTEFLYKYAGVPGISKEATVNQICPDRLEKMFRENCIK